MKTASPVLAFIKKNTVLVTALTLAFATAFIVPPDKKYVEYFDFKTLSCLFLILAIVCALRNISFFMILSKKIVSMFKTTRQSILAIVYITFIGSMFIANDMALITFLPLGYIVLSSCKKSNYMAFTFIMQNIAANLGGMLTPFGNPQNLYLYTKFHISNQEFIKIMFLPFIISIAIITICCVFVRSEHINIEAGENLKLDIKKFGLYIVLFTAAILIIFRLIPYPAGLLVITSILYLTDKKALRMVDYPLLFTFAAFFIFAGNMTRIPFVSEFLSKLLSRDTLLVSILSCQMISNVPTAVLLSQFTNNYRELLIGVNIGGVGTMIASLASLITFREFQKYNPGRTWHYIKMFSVFNFGFLITLILLT